MTMHKEFYYGAIVSSTEPKWVYVDIHIHPDTSDRQREVTFTDHSSRPAPVRLSITWTVVRAWKTKPHPARVIDMSDSRWISAGQVPPEERRIVASPWSKDQRALIEDAWANWHLNDMNAACDHMDTTVPEGEHDRMAWRVNNLVCPVTGYKYGHSWLAKRVPQHILDGLYKIGELV